MFTKFSVLLRTPFLKVRHLLRTPFLKVRNLLRTPFLKVRNLLSHLSCDKAAMNITRLVTTNHVNV